MAEQLQQVVQAAFQAAQAASNAAKTMEETMAKRVGSSKFGEASKVIRMPDCFGTEGDHDAEQSRWPEFSMGFKAWLYYAEKEYEKELTYVEDNVKTSQPLSSMNEDSKSRAEQLYSILTGLLRGRPLKILRSVNERNGYEVWRQLVVQYSPKTKGRAISVLSAYMNFPAFDKSKTFLEHIQSLERVRTEYRKVAGVDIGDDLQLSVLIRCLPKYLQQHIQLQLTESSSYQNVRDAVLSYETVTQSWSEKKVLTELGVVGAGSSASGPVPMEVDAVQQFGGYGKGKKGKGKGKSDGKSYKGKNGKGSYGYSDKGKGKGKSKNDGKGSWSTSQKFQGHCNFCGKYGRKEADCRKKKGGGKSDAGKKGVRQVEELPTTDGATSTAGGVPNSGAVKMISFAPAANCNDDDDSVVDLTVFDNLDGGVFALRVSQTDNSEESCGQYLCSGFECVYFDLFSSDHDDAWTLAPDLISDISPCRTGHLCTVSGDLEGYEEIIFDSGADVSALPLRFSHVGVATTPNENMYVDAQGNKIDIADTRLAKVQFDSVSLKEKFIISAVTSPLICMGHMIRDGWSLINSPEGQWLTKGKHSIRVWLRGNSVVGSGKICMLKSEPALQSTPLHVRTVVRLLPVLQQLKPGWNCIRSYLHAMISSSPYHQDISLIPNTTELMWYRTTLVLKNETWVCIEDGVDITTLSEMYSFINDLEIDKVLTLGHNVKLEPKYLGFLEVEAGDDMGDLEQSASSSGHRQPDLPMPPIVEEHVVPAAPDEAEPEEVDRPEPLSSHEVIVDGVTLNSNTTLKVIRTACESLGLAKSGSKAKCLARLHNFLSTQELVAQHAASTALKSETERAAVTLRVPEQPSEEERKAHSLTHQPYKQWCEYCIANRARQDPHPAAHAKAGSSIVSFDYGYITRLEGEQNKLTCLFIHDQFTKMVHAVPTEQKADRSLKYLCTELVRFVLYLGHSSVTLRSDNEPSQLSLIAATRKSLRSFGVECHVETVPVGSHASNGAAESTVNVIRQLSNTLMQQLEHQTGAEKPVFAALHPLVAWSLVHASWIHNRFVVNQGQTSFERSFDRPYTGKVCMFAEQVMAYVKTDRKGAPRWRKGVWLTKTMNNDSHVVAVGGSIVCTRSVRRLATQWDLKMCGDIESGPWSYGLASLGAKLVVNKRIVNPKAVTFEQLGGDEAGDDPPSEEERLKGPLHISDSTTLDALMAPRAGGAEVLEAPEHSTEAGQLDVEVPNPPLGPQPPGPIVARRDAVELAAARQGYESTMDELRGDRPVLEPSERPSKQSKLSAPQQNVMRVEMQHEDEPNELVFEDAELDTLENYDYDYDEEGEDHFLEHLSEDVESLIDNCCYPFSQAEPELDGEALQELDALADHIEISRLVGLGVLISPENVGDGAKHLSTKFVRTWRCKTRHDVKVWLRRARYVAREFTWMSPERQDLFSPASSSIITRILPYCFLKQSTVPGSDVCMASMDITDAFLTVDQEVPTVVDCNGTLYGLGKVLPGQRDGSQLWYKSITKYLETRLGLEPLDACPCLLKREDLSLVMLMHVDDLLLVGSKRFIEHEVVPTLLEKYKVSLEILQKQGDELEFLKRRHSLIAPGQLVIYPHSKHFEKLFDMVGVKKTWKPKHVPGHGMINEFDETEELDSDKSSRYRSSVGILLYLAHDLIECQFVIRGLARYMSKPTERAWDILKYLVQYLLGRIDYGLLMKIEENHTSNTVDLFVYSDSDWAGHKGSRKSASSCFVKVDGTLLHSSSRTQGIIALSSGEAECYAGVSSSCDGIYLKRCLEFCSGLQVNLKLLLDSSSARQILARSGVGRIRHLSVKVLWLQQKVETKEIQVCAVSTTDNIADLGTKRLNCNTTRYLMYLCGVFDGSELVGKAEYHEMQRKRLLGKMSHNHVQRFLQIALMLQFPDNALSLKLNMAGGALGELGVIQSLYMQLSYFLDTLYMQLSYLHGKVYENFLGLVGVLVLVLTVMVGYYKVLWKKAVAEGDQLLEISEKLASQQHRRALEGLQEFRAFTRRRRRRLAFGGRLDIDDPQGEPGVQVDAAETLPESREPADAGVQTNESEPESEGPDSRDIQAERMQRYRHCGMDEASDIETWMEVRHFNRRGEYDQFVHSDDMELINAACDKYDMDVDQFVELLEGYGGDHLKRQILTALGTVMYYHDQGRDEEANRLMCDVQYKVGGSTFVHLHLRDYLPDAERQDLRLYYEELNESVVVRLVNRTSELLKMPDNLKEPFITRLMELSNPRRAEFMTRMRRFEVSARAGGDPPVGNVMNISRALEEYIGTRFVPPCWRPYLEFDGSDLEGERFHGPMEVDDSEETVRQQAAMEDGLAEAYRMDAIRNRTIRRLRDRAEQARIRAEFEEADAMEDEADLLGVL